MSSWADKFAPPPPPALKAGPGGTEPEVEPVADTGAEAPPAAPPRAPRRPAGRTSAPAAADSPAQEPDPGTGSGHPATPAAARRPDLHAVPPQQAPGPEPERSEQDRSASAGDDVDGGVTTNHVGEPEPGSEAEPVGPAKALAAWIPAHLRDAARAAREPTGESFTEFFLAAFNRTWNTLPSMFPHARTPAGPMPMRTTRHRRNVDTAVQVWLYLDPTQTRVLEETIETTRAGSRSALVSAVLAADLKMPSS